MLTHQTSKTPPDMNHSSVLRGLAASALLAGIAGAQIKSDGVPAAVSNSLATGDVPTEFVQPPDVEAYKAEDAANGYRPLRYGALMPVDIGADAQGVWDVLADGTQVWRFRVQSPGAFTIGLEFDDFVLPEGSSVFMYDETLETVFGAYGAINNQPNGEILMEPFPGDSVIFEYLQPAGVTGTPELHLGTVIYDYRNVDAIDVEDFIDPGGVAQGSCLVDVNCPEGANWELQKRAVVRTLSGGGLCSGALVNNTAENGTGYVYTADHCGQSSNTSFRFNYQRSGCGTGTAPTTQNVSGCTVLTTSSTFDSRLLRINNTIPSNYNPYYAGWSRSSTNPNFVFSMGHPSGGPKKISIDQNGATKGSISISNSAWFVDWSLGYLEGGSSGGPLFQQDGLVIGPACCVNNFNCSTQVAWYGRFDRFYNNNGISQWLDPAGSNPTILQGHDPQNPGGPGGGGFQIDSVSPNPLPTVQPTSPVAITLTGSGFTGTTDVRFDGQSLGGFPPQYTVVNDSTITMTMVGPFDLGVKTIEVVKGSSTETIDLPVTYPSGPTVDLANSDPGFLIQAVGLDVSMSSLPGDLHVLLVSTDLIPSTLPGFFSVDIGNNLTTLYEIGTYVVNPAIGHASVNIPVSGLASGTKIHFQTVVFPAVLPTLPLAASNVDTGTVLF